MEFAWLSFETQAFVWRGPAPFLFAAVPEQHIAELHHAARLASYGWGVIPVEVRRGRVYFTTSLFPRDGGYLIPIKLTVQRDADISAGDRFAVEMRVRPRG